MYEEWEPEEPKRRRSRANGEGSIRKRDNNTYEGRYTVGFVNGKQIVRSVYGKTRKECNDKMQAAIKEAREHNIVLESKSPTLREWLLIWLNEYRKDLGAISRKRHLSAIKRMSEELANKKISEVLPLDLQQFINSLSSNDTAQRAMGLLNAALTDAMGNGFINRNPAIALRNPFPQPAARFEESKKAFTKQEESDFVNAIQENPYKFIYYLVLYAGLRRGEAVALTWNNIEFETRQIHVNAAAKRGYGKGYTVGTTKTTTGIRTVPMSPILYNLLVTEKKSSGFICPKPNGDMINADIITGDFGEVMKQIGQQHTLYHLRHTFATRCIVDKGISPKVVQVWMGHAKIDMTMNTYTHATA
ncbi:MAG: site-specific integrase, partial [Clostridiales bacterium]|nr:site-specific integrase [Clostridiales bacterium]